MPRRGKAATCRRRSQASANLTDDQGCAAAPTALPRRIESPEGGRYLGCVMLEDRDYMRPEGPKPGLVFRLSATVWIIVVNFAVFAMQLIFPLATAGGGRDGVFLEDYLALHPAALLHGAVWQLLTFQFLHGGIGHLSLNCLTLYLFGRPLEQDWGKRRFLWLYFGAGVGGGLLQAICGLLFPGHFGLAPTLGASAGVFGLVAAFAWQRWDEPLNLLVAFVLPVTIKAKWLLAVETALALLGLLRPDQIAHAAHLGGILVGVALARAMEKGLWQERPRAISRVMPHRPSPLRVEPATVASPTRSPRSASRPDQDADFISREVDPILEKISAHGIQSLTAEERRVLERARDWMSGQ